MRDVFKSSVAMECISLILLTLKSSMIFTQIFHMMSFLIHFEMYMFQIQKGVIIPLIFKNLVEIEFSYLNSVRIDRVMDNLRAD